MKYRTKPTVIEATQYNWGPGEVDRLVEWSGDVTEFGPNGLWSPPEHATLRFWIEKSKTWGELEDGDWIIKEPDGDGVYPCKRDIFEMKYEVA